MHRVGFVLRAGAAGWMGGVNYLRNLLEAIVAVDAPFEPVLFVGPDLEDRILADFPPVEVVVTDALAPPRLPPIARMIAAEQVRRDARLDAELARHSIALLSHTVLFGKPRVPAMGWIPDFQHVRLPEMFSRVERVRRDLDFRRVVRGSLRIIVSSRDAAADLARFAPEAARRCAVLPFAVAPVEVGHDDAIVRRMGLDRYIHLPNQLWRHKNHAIAVEALGRAADAVPDLTIVCTGDVDPRAPEQPNALAERAARLGIADRFRLLGRVNYDDMVALMRHAHAVLNPSLFEGWSTTVEEARALGKRMVLSDIPVHREQAPDGAVFFDPRDAASLAAALARVWDGPGDVVAPEPAAAAARERHRDFGLRYVALAEEAVAASVRRRSVRRSWSRARRRGPTPARRG